MHGNIMEVTVLLELSLLIKLTRAALSGYLLLCPKKRFSLGRVKRIGIFGHRNVILVTRKKYCQIWGGQHCLCAFLCLGKVRPLNSAITPETPLLRQYSTSPEHLSWLELLEKSLAVSELLRKLGKEKSSAAAEMASSSWTTACSTHSGKVPSQNRMK